MYLTFTVASFCKVEALYSAFGVCLLCWSRGAQVDLFSESDIGEYKEIVDVKQCTPCAWRVACGVSHHSSVLH